MIDNPFLQYRRTQTETSAPGELVVLLYQGAIRFLQRSLDALKQGDYASAGESIIRAEEIIVELNTTLDTSVGDVAVNLSRIYDYAYWRLVEGNTRKNPAPIEEVLRLLQELLPAWQEAVRANAREHARHYTLQPARSWVAAG